MIDLKESGTIQSAAIAKAVAIYDKPNRKIVGDYPTATVEKIESGIAKGYITLLFENDSSVSRSYFRAQKINNEYVVTITSDFND